jgi:sigma-B regulation protein RsbU (phosphoserine phosphatase)
MDANDILTTANEKLCENNEASMFVTAWIGILDTKTGKLRYSNAGHNPPLILRKNEEFQYLRSNAGFVLAGIEGMRYGVNELQMNNGDRIFLYTDGVTEATNSNNMLYGEERLIQYMNSNKDKEGTILLQGLKSDIDLFVGEAPQFDDITMLIFDYNPENENIIMEKRVFPARTDELDSVLGFIEDVLNNNDCPLKTTMAVCVAIEEVFVNIANYAYGDKEGEVEVEVSFDRNSRQAIFRMSDSGIPFNPLDNPDPDVTLSAQERDIGGLGIFITKKTMDKVSYSYENGRNVLTMTKNI